MAWEPQFAKSYFSQNNNQKYWKNLITLFIFALLQKTEKHLYTQQQNIKTNSTNTVMSM